MPFRYDQSSGAFHDPDGELLGYGYSGRKGVTRNNGLCEAQVARGPIPVGVWQISQGPEAHAGLAAPVFRLTPVNFNAHGRSGFLIHGNNTEDDASQGCIILPKPLREAIATTSDRVLIVEA